MDFIDTETGIIIGIFVILMMYVLLTYIMSVIGMWKMFTKAGEKGWKSLIPIYNQYTLAVLTGVSPYWILIVYCCIFIGSLIPGLSLLGTVANAYFKVIQSVSTAKSFNKDEAFAVGIFFLSPIFYLILGIGKTEYIGKKPMNDPIMDLINKK